MSIVKIGGHRNNYLGLTINQYGVPLVSKSWRYLRRSLLQFVLYRLKLPYLVRPD